MSKKTISNSVIWQLGGKFALQGIAFFTTPIFTRLLTPADFGYTSIYISWLSIFRLLVGLCINGSIGNARIKFGEETLTKYLSSIITISVISFATIFFFLLVFHKFFENVLKMQFGIIVILCLHSFSHFVINFEITRLDQLKCVEKSTILSVTLSAFSILLSLFFVVMADSDKGNARIYGQALPNVVYGFVILFLIYFRGRKIWDFGYVKFTLSLTLPLILHNLGHLIFSQSDRLMLQRMQGDNIAGIYSVSFSLCSVLSIIYGALNVSWSPFYYDFKKQDATEEILSHSKRYIKFFTLVSVGFVLLVYDVYKLMAPPSYSEGKKILFLFSIANYFSFLYLFPVNFEFFNARTKLIPIMTFTIAIINVFMNWLLIPKYGILGAAIGTLVAHVGLFIFHWISASFIIKGFEYPWHIFLPGIAVLVGFTLLSLLFQGIPVVRLTLALFIGIYLLTDILKHRSIF